MKNTLLGSIYLILASSIWGGMYVVVKVVVAFIPPLELVWLRYLIAILALLLIGFVTKQKWRIEKRFIWIIIAIGIIGNAISIVAQETGTMLSTAQMGAIITASTPAFMVIFARLILKESLTIKMLSHNRCYSYCWDWGYQFVQFTWRCFSCYCCLNMGTYVCSCETHSKQLLTNCRNNLFYFSGTNCVNAICFTTLT